MFGTGGTRGGSNTWLEITLREGRKRQIRHMCEEAGSNVLRLVRVAIGPLRLGALPQGEWRELTSTELQQLKGSVMRQKADPS